MFNQLKGLRSQSKVSQRKEKSHLWAATLAPAQEYAVSQFPYRFQTCQPERYIYTLVRIPASSPTDPLLLSQALLPPPLTMQPAPKWPKSKLLLQFMARPTSPKSQGQLIGLTVLLILSTPKANNILLSYYYGPEVMPSTFYALSHLTLIASYLIGTIIIPVSPRKGLKLRGFMQPKFTQLLRQSQNLHLLQQYPNPSFSDYFLRLQCLCPAPRLALNLFLT